MPEERKTKRELLQELDALRRHIAQLEQADRERQEREVATSSKFPDENPNPVLRISEQGTILYANTASAPVLETWRIHVGGTLPEGCYKRVKEALSTTKESIFEFNCDNGRIFLVSLAPIVDEGYLNAYGIDITERKKAEQDLRRSDDRLRLFMDSATEGFTLWDSEFNLVIANKTVLNMFPPDTKLENLLGKNALEIVPNLRESGRYDRYMEVIKTGKSLFFNDLVPHPKFGDIHIDVEAFRVGDGLGMIINDITKHKETEKRQALRFQILDTLHQHESLKTVCERIVSLIKEHLDCDAVALRMKDGDDYPYFVSNGFPQGFIESENYLCIHDEKGHCLRDSHDNPLLACMCGMIINSKFDPDRPFFTKRGSFWTNSTTVLLASTTAETRGGTTRNTCNQYGYESVSLIPIESKGDNVGLLQINAERRNLFSLGGIQFLEELGQLIGIAMNRKKTEKAVLDSEEKYRTLVEGTGESIVTIDENGVFLFMNSIGAERLGGKPEDYIGKTMWDLFPKEIADQQAETVRRVIRSEQGVDRTVLTEIRGRPRWYHATTEPLRDGSGKVVAAMVIARDVHALKQAQDQLNEYRDQMARAEQLASIGTVGAMAAHELTQPLTVIRLSIENLLLDLDGMSCPNGVRESLKDSLVEISQIASLIDRLRNFARVSSDREVKYVHLNAVAKKVTQLLDAQIWREGMTVNLKNIDNLPPVFTCKKDMEQLFFALVENTIQAANGKKGCQLIINGILKDQHVELQFSDNCGGIPPENLDKIFDSFFTTKPAGEGTGLGLCVVERIISQAGGNIRVESKYGEGTTFFVNLPIKQIRRV